jgi:Chalcone isomerase-like
LRRPLTRKILPALTGLWLASNAGAATLSGVTLPDSYTVDGQFLPLNGIGLRTLTIFRVRIYVAALYLAQPSHDAAQILASPGPKVILLRFIHSGTKAEVEKEYREGEAKNCGQGECAPTDQADFERLVAAAPAVSPGDTSTYVFAHNRVKVFANNQMIGDFADVDLAHRLLGGFIGAHPPSEALRDQLLGLPAQ